MVNDQNSRHARESSKEDFEYLSMMAGESARGYVARAKGLANVAEYHVSPKSEWLSPRNLNGA